jgi:hypothetical protein
MRKEQDVGLNGEHIGQRLLENAFPCLTTLIARDNQGREGNT